MGDRKRVLIVDDNIGDVKLIRYGLEQGPPDVAVDHVFDGQAALDYLSVHPSPDLILMDINMPGMDGVECLRKMRSAPNCKRLQVVVMLTTSHSQRLIDASYEAGANGYIVKPAGLDELEATLKTTKEFWLDVAQRPSP